MDRRPMPAAGSRAHRPTRMRELGGPAGTGAAGFPAAYCACPRIRVVESSRNSPLHSCDAALAGTSKEAGKSTRATNLAKALPTVGWQRRRCTQKLLQDRSVV